MDRAAIGRSAEDIAAEFLTAQGLRWFLRNYRRRGGELDVVAREGDVLVIAEVRTRSSDAFGGAAASVDGWKQHKIIRRGDAAASAADGTSRSCACDST